MFCCACAGGRAVLLRMPAPASAGDATEQLGLAVPEFQDVELAPVVFRKARASATEGKAAKREMMVSASAVNALVGSLGYSAASVLFATAFGVLVDGVLMEVVSADGVGGGWGAVCLSAGAAGAGGVGGLAAWSSMQWAKPYAGALR